MTFIELCEFVLNFLELKDYNEIISDEFCYYRPEDDVIAMNYDDAFENADLFYEFLDSEVYPKAKEFNIILWSLLHEYGHLKDGEDPSYDMILRSLLSFAPSSSSKTMAYFRLPRERNATTWAANYIRLNYDKCLLANDIIKDWIERNI